MTGDHKITQQEAWELGGKPQIETEEIKMGALTSYSLLNDPKHMCFVLSRYKFCAKILDEKKHILEIGCGDGFGTPIVAQGADYLLAIDITSELIESNKKRLGNLLNIEFKTLNICTETPGTRFDGVFSIDVIEHLDPHLEEQFMINSCKSLRKNGICIIGTPNISASKYATERSRVQHINLKSHKTLKNLMKKYFENVLMFSMNDEVLHTGYYPMGHYIFGVGVGLKK